MSWGPIVVGVDNSPEAAGAAVVAHRIARAAAENCHLVHATRDVWAPFAAVGEPKQVQEMQRLQLAVARHQVTEALRSGVAPELLEGLDVRLGPAAVVLQAAARDRGAGRRAWKSRVTHTARMMKSNQRSIRNSGAPGRIRTCDP